MRLLSRIVKNLRGKNMNGQVPGIPVMDNKDFLEIYETYQAIEEVYNDSLTAMGLRASASLPLCANTNVSLGNLQSVSTR